MLCTVDFFAFKELSFDYFKAKKKSLLLVLNFRLLLKLENGNKLQKVVEMGYPFIFFLHVLLSG